MKKETPIGTSRQAKCKKCKKGTKQTLKLYNPHDPDGGTVWYCENCKDNVEWESKAKS